MSIYGIRDQEKRAQDLGFASIDDLLHRLESAEPRYTRIPSDSWSMELTVLIHHVGPPLTTNFAHQVRDDENAS